jgi:two-component system sensor kinase FixL
MPHSTGAGVQGGSLAPGKNAGQRADLLMSIFDRVSDGIICCDAAGTLTVFNEVACRLLGCSAGSAQGRPLKNFFPKASKLLSEDAVGVERSLLAVAADGSSIPLAGVAGYVSHGKERCFCITFRPPTTVPLDRHDSARLAAIVESSDDAIIGKTLDGIIVSWNKGAERIFGYAAAEMVGRHISKLIPPGHESEEPEIQERLRIGGRVDHFDTVRVTKNGKLVDVSLTISPIRDESGRIVGASKIARDITEAKRIAAAQEENEQRMRLAADAAKLGLWDWDLRTKTMTRSATLAKLMGTSQLQSEYDLESVEVHPDDRESTRLKLQDAISSGNEYVNEFRSMWPDGSIHWLEGRGRAIYDDRGDAQRMLGIVVDITERKNTEEAARLREAELAHMSRISTMGNMASGLAHEINQPLGAILNYAGVCMTLLKSSPLAIDGFRIALEEVMSETRRASAIIRRIRSFVTKQTPKSALVDLNDLIQRSIALLDFELRHQSIRPNMKLATGIPLVRADAIQIEQVIVNLIYNAMQAMAEQSADDRKLTVETKCLSATAVEVNVIDTGPGMSPENLARLFQPFFTTKAQGMGMGLNISRSIIESHGGRMNGTPRAAGGMRFGFTLPIERGRQS